MKKQSSHTNRCNLAAPPTDDELLVCSILIDLEAIIAASSESHRLQFTWPVKRRRSRLPSRPPPSLGREIELEKTQVKQPVNGGAATASPDTPLSFSPSESDDDDDKSNSNNNNNISNKHFAVQRNSKKRSREEFVDMVEQLTQRRDCLRGEVENVRKYYNQLVSQNTQLKAMKQEVLKSYQREKNPVMEMSRPLKQRTELAQNYYASVAIPYLHQSIPTDQKSSQQQTFNPFGPITAQFYGGLGSVNPVGPKWIPDLNISADEAFGMNFSQPLDVSVVSEADRRARFAEARRKRRGMIKIKAMRSACGITLPRHS